MIKILKYPLILGLLLFFQGISLAESDRYAILLKIEGEVQVRQNASDWKPAQAGMILHANDEIRTGKNSEASVLLDDNGSSGKFEIKKESRLRLSTLGLDKQTGYKTTVLDLAIGKALVHAEKLGDNSKFNVRTPNSTTGVRGTTFSITAEPKK